MKLKTYRISNRPISVEHLEAYEVEFKAYFDKASFEAGPNMKLLSRYLSFGEHCLNKKYKVDVETEIPKSAKGWNKLIESFAGCPIMVAQSEDRKSLVLVLMDQF